MIIAGYNPSVGGSAWDKKKKDQDLLEQFGQDQGLVSPSVEKVSSDGGTKVVGNTVNTGTSSHLNGNVMNNAAHSDGVYNNKDTVDDEGVVVTSPASAPSVNMSTSSVGGTSSASGSSVPTPSGGNKTSSSPTIEEFYDDEGEDLENQTSGETDGETGDGEDDEAFADLGLVIDELLNFKYKDFSYDPLSDPTYLQYQKQYQRNAQAAMENAAALAATRTGGYGNSYASVASQQAYDAQMDELNDILPQLYEQAYSRHQTEESQRLQQLLNEYTVLSGEREYADGREDTEWEKWFRERAYTDERTDAAWDKEYKMAQFEWEKEIYEKAESDAAAENIVNGYLWAIEQYEGDDSYASLSTQLAAMGYSDAEVADIMSRVQSVYKAGYKSSTERADEAAYGEQVTEWLDLAEYDALTASQKKQILADKESGKLSQTEYNEIVTAYSADYKQQLVAGTVFTDGNGTALTGSQAKAMVDNVLDDKLISESVKKELVKQYNDKYAIYKCVYSNGKPWGVSNFGSLPAGFTLHYGEDIYAIDDVGEVDDEDVLAAAADLDDLTVFVMDDVPYIKGDDGKIYEIEKMLDALDGRDTKKFVEFIKNAQGKGTQYTGVTYG